MTDETKIEYAVQRRRLGFPWQMVGAGPGSRDTAESDYYDWLRDISGDDDIEIRLVARAIEPWTDVTDLSPRAVEAALFPFGVE